jgi:hypothetical protein
MPKVGSKKFSYTKSGAKAEGKKTGKKVVKQSKNKGY